MAGQRAFIGIDRATFVGLFIASIGLLAAELGGELIGEWLGVSRPLLLSLAGWWLLTGLLLALVLFWEGRPLSSIGIRQPSISTVGWGIGAFIVGVLAFGFTFPLVDAFGLGTTVEGIEWLVQFPVWLLIVTAVTAGFTEEVMFRGYLLERVGELTGALWIGAVISAVVFTLVHIPLWGVGGALQIGVWTIVVTVLYVKTHNLWACIVMHVLNDLYAFIVAPLVFL